MEKTKTNPAVETARDILSDKHHDGKLSALVDLYAICNWEPMFSGIVKGLTGMTPAEVVKDRVSAMRLTGYSLPD